MKKQTGFRHAHDLGQNFISDEALLDQLVAIAGVTKEDSVFEVGSGMGDLSCRLALAAKKLITVEVDERLLPFIRLKLDKMDNAEVVHADAQKLNLDEMLRPLAPLRIVANLPYHLTTPLMEQFLLLNAPLRSISVMVQKEAAQRLVARPRQEGWGPLAILAQVKTLPKEKLFVPRACFTPPPKVDSAFVHLPARETPPVEARHMKGFLRVVRAGFSNRRKTLINNLMPFFGLSRPEAEDILNALHFAPTLRAEEMDIGDFEALRAALEVYKGEQP